MEGGQVSDDYKASMLFSRSVVSNSLRPHGHSPPGSAVHEIFQARTLEWIAISFARRSSQPRNWTHSSCLAGALPLSTWEALSSYCCVLKLLRVFYLSTVPSAIPFYEPTPGSRWGFWGLILAAWERMSWLISNVCSGQADEAWQTCPIYLQLLEHKELNLSHGEVSVAKKSWLWWWPCTSRTPVGCQCQPLDDK